MDTKTKIAKNFSLKSKKYNDFAVLQKKVALSLIKFGKSQINSSEKILDVGCGTGFIAENIGRKITQLDISEEMCKLAKKFSPAICADFDNIPFEKNYFDMVTSSLAFQWSPNLKITFNEIARTLKKNGYFLFTTFTNNSLKELQNSHNDFLSQEKIKSEVLKNFKIIKKEITSEKSEFESKLQALKDMKNIGANTNLTSKKFTKEEYKKLKNPEKIVTSWEVIKILAQKS